MADSEWLTDCISDLMSCGLTYLVVNLEKNKGCVQKLIFCEIRRNQDWMLLNMIKQHTDYILFLRGGGCNFSNLCGWIFVCFL